jgi:drug/metabolite transporter (DMT)-like permease
MFTWFVFALLSIFVLAGSEISQKISLTQKVNISAVTNNFFVWTFQGIAGLVLALLFNQIHLDITPTLLLKLLALGIVYFLGGTFFYSSFKGNSPSISVILGSISVVISSTLGIIFFNESTNNFKFLGLALILSSILFLNLNKSEKLNKFNLLALAGGTCYGLAYTLDKSFVLQLNPIFYISLLCFTVALVSITLRSKQIISEAKTLKIQNYYPMLMSAFFGTLFNLFTFLAYSKGADVGIVDAMNNSSIFLIILIEILFLNDRTSLKRKLLCATLATVGISLFALYR